MIVSILTKTLQNTSKTGHFCPASFHSVTVCPRAVPAVPVCCALSERACVSASIFFQCSFLQSLRSYCLRTAFFLPENVNNYISRTAGEVTPFTLLSYFQNVSRPFLSIWVLLRNTRFVKAVPTSSKTGAPAGACHSIYFKGLHPLHPFTLLH